MLNLHDVVRGAIIALHPDEEVQLYQSTGQKNVRGKITATYAEPITVMIQIQGNGTDALAQTESVSTSTIERRAWLYTPDESFPPDGLHRALARTGDYILRPDGTWWLVTTVLDEFAKSGWVSVGLTEQVRGPAGVTA